jgi:hypothetical protein
MLVRGNVHTTSTNQYTTDVLKIAKKPVIQSAQQQPISKYMTNASVDNIYLEQVANLIVTKKNLVCTALMPQKQYAPQTPGSRNASTASQASSRA